MPYGLAASLVMCGTVSKSATTMERSEIPGMLVEFFRRVGFVVNKRSDQEWPKVWWVDCVFGTGGLLTCYLQDLAVCHVLEKIRGLCWCSS